MHCKVGWNTSFIRSTFPSTWLSKDYKDVREKILFDLELAKIPDTQRFCDASVRRNDLKQKREEALEAIKILKEEVSLRQKQYEECNQDIWILNEENNTSEELAKLKEHSHKLYLDIKHQNNQLEQSNETIASLTTQINRLTHDIEGSNGIEKEDVSFYLACPTKNCRGFINKQWKCGICSSRICSDCHEVKPDMGIHQCDPDVKASVDVLRKDSKPCPKCASLIHKISGCDQMWCTRCRTAFSWNTGAIEETVHNPHFFEWLRTRDDNHVDGAIRPRDDDTILNCNEYYVTEANTFSIVQKIRGKVEDSHQRGVIMDIIRLLIHISQSEIPGLVPSYAKVIPHDPNRELRIRYMLNEITLDEFKAGLAKREKDRLKREELSNILQTFLQVGDDLAWSFLHEDKLMKDTFLQEMETLRIYTNECLRKVAEQYSCKVRCIEDTFRDLVTFEKPSKEKKDTPKEITN